MEQRQEQYQGPERRQSQTQYQGEERRASAAHPGMSTQERKDEQQERARQQYENRHDEL
jgi:hypothetical protein